MYRVLLLILLALTAGTTSAQNRAIFVVLLILLALTAGTTSAQNRAIFVDGFDPPSFSQRFPLVSGSARLPPGPAANQIRWLVGELAMGKHTTPAQVAQHFIAGYDPGTIAAWINDTLRPAFADARIVDVPALTPYGGTVVIQGNIPANPLGYVSFQTHYTGDQKFGRWGIGGEGRPQWPMRPDHPAQRLNAACHRLHLQELGALRSRTHGR